MNDQWSEVKPAITKMIQTPTWKNQLILIEDCKTGQKVKIMVVSKGDALEKIEIEVPFIFIKRTFFQLLRKC